MAQLTSREWNLVKGALPKAKGQRTAQELAAMESYRKAGKPSGPGVSAGGTRQGINPRTGLGYGVDPNKALTGTYAGKTMPRGGKSLNAQQIASLKGKSPEEIARLSRLMVEDPDMLQAYGAEEGIYGKGGYKNWQKEWNQAFKKAGMKPVKPEKWLKLMGYDENRAPGARPSELDQAKWTDQTKKLMRQYKKKGLGGVSPAAGSGPFDIGARTPESQVMLLNQALGRNYGSLQEAMSDLAPLAGWAGAQWESLDPSERAAANPLQQAYLAISRLGPRHGAENTARINTGGDIPATNFLLDEFFGAGKAQRKLLLKQLGMVTKDMPEYLTNAYKKIGESEAVKSGQANPDEIFYQAMINLAGPDAETNWRDPTKPLFAMGNTPGMASGGNMPGRLMQGALAAPGLDQYLASLSPEEFLGEYAPLAWQQANDPAFREKQAQLAEKTHGGSLYSGPKQTGPLTNLPSWNRFRAYGGMFGGGIQPGAGRGANFQGGTQQLFSRTESPYRGWENDPMYGSAQWSQLGLPQVKSTAWPNFDMAGIDSLEEWKQQFAGLPTAGNLQQWIAQNQGQVPDFLYNNVEGYQNLWNSNALSGYAPWQIGDPALSRIIMALGGAQGQGGMYL